MHKNYTREMDKTQAWTQLWEERDPTMIFNPIMVSFLLLSFLFLFKLSRSNRNGLPPSPRRLPIIGNLHQIGKTPHLSLRALSEKYGPLMLLHFGSVPTLVVSSAELAMEILKTQEAVFKNRPVSKATSSIFANDIVFGKYDDHWRQARKISVLELLSARRVQSLQFIREEEVNVMVEKLRNVCRDRSSVDLCKMMTAISSNIVTRSVLGKKYDGSDDNEINLGEALKDALGFLASFWFEDLIPYLGWIDTLTGKTARLKEASQKLHRFLDHVIDEHQIPKSDDDQLTDKKDFVDIILHLQNNKLLDIDITRDRLRSLLLDMIFGGTDTGAALMEWTMAELMKNPTPMKKAQDEVRKVVGGKSKVEEVDLNKMDYLKCVIKEALRLHGVFFLGRESCTSFTLGGYSFPPNTGVYILLWAIQRDPRLWDKSEEFVPERFSNEKIDLKGQDFRFFPFGSGRRGCPGITYAVAEVEYVIANLLYWFDWNLPDGITTENLDMEEAFKQVNCKKIPLSLVPVLHTH